MAAVHIVQDPTSGGTGGGAVIADRELWTDANRERLLDAGDPDAALLVVSHPGKPIPPEFVLALRLEAGSDGKVKQMKERTEGRDKELSDGRTKTPEGTPPNDARVDQDGVPDPVVAIGADALKDLPDAQLREIAKQRHVPRASKLSREELVAAIVEGGELQAGGPNPDQDSGPSDETPTDPPAARR